MPAAAALASASSFTYRSEYLTNAHAYPRRTSSALISTPSTEQTPRTRSYLSVPSSRHVTRRVADQLSKCIRRRPSAGPFPAIRSAANLRRFGSINSFEANTFSIDINGVAVDHGCGAGEFGIAEPGESVGIRRQRQGHNNATQRKRHRPAKRQSILGFIHRLNLEIRSPISGPPDGAIVDDICFTALTLLAESRPVSPRYELSFRLHMNPIGRVGSHTHEHIRARCRL